jgi:hypothetical protein
MVENQDPGVPFGLDAPAKGISAEELEAQLARVHQDAAAVLEDALRHLDAAVEEGRQLKARLEALRRRHAALLAAVPAAGASSAGTAQPKGPTSKDVNK